MGVEGAAAGQGVLVEEGEDRPGGPPRIGRGAHPFHGLERHAQDAMFAGVIHPGAGKGIAPEQDTYLCNLHHPQTELPKNGAIPTKIQASLWMLRALGDRTISTDI